MTTISAQCHPAITTSHTLVNHPNRSMHRCSSKHLSCLGGAQPLCRHVPPGFPIILVTYHGESCDLQWIWKLAQAPRSTISLHPQVKYFLAPYKVISDYKTCPFHPSKSRLEKLELGAVWKHLMGQNLNGAHNSLVDVRSQTDIVTSLQLLSIV